tara:strand:- start:2956 stop:4377 length:1422 start_codon:yes stop_codon:yes gene_type:complete
MAWDVVSKTANSVLGSSEVNQLQDNFAALAAQDSGAPSIDVDSFMSVVASISQIYVGSGIHAPQISSFGTLDVSSLNLNGNPAAAIIVTKQQTDYTITVADAEGFKVITNEDAVAAIAYTLPESGAKKISIIAVESYTIDITATASDSISDKGSASEVAGTYRLDEYAENATLIRAVDYKWFILYGTGNLTKPRGWLFGAGGGSDDIEELLFSTEIFTLLAEAMQTASRSAASCSASALTGAANVYIFCGNGGSVISKFQTSDETEANLVEAADGVRNGTAGGMSSTKGYHFGGHQPGDDFKTTIFDIIHSTELSATLGAVLSAVAGDNSCASSSTKTYISLGYNGSALDILNAFTHSGETRATLAATLDAARGGSAGVQSSTKAYFMGGDASTAIDEIIFSTELSVAISATLSTARDGSSSDPGASSSTKGYTIGCASNASEALTFSGETTAVVTDTLAASKGNVPASQTQT